MFVAGITENILITNKNLSCLCFVAVYLHFPVQFYVLFVFCCCLPSLPSTILRTFCVLLLFTFTFQYNSTYCLCFVAVYLHFPVQFYVLFVFCCCLPSLPSTILRIVCVLFCLPSLSSTILRTVCVLLLFTFTSQYNSTYCLCFVAVYLHFPVQFYVLFVFCCCLPSLPSTILRTAHTASLPVQALYCSYKQALISRYINSNRPDHDQQHRSHHAPTVKPEAGTAVVELLMMA